MPQTAAVATYGMSFSAAVEQGLVSGVQFHPEKSGEVGLRVLRNWVEMVYDRSRVELAAWDSPADDLAVSLGGIHPERAPARLSKRIIACLDVRDGEGGEGHQLRGPARGRRSRRAGAALQRRGHRRDRHPRRHRDARGAAGPGAHHPPGGPEIFLPLCVGGGIRTEADAAAAIEAGADKVSLNTAALLDPALITTLAARYGSQAVVVAIDARRDGDRYAVYVRSGSSDTARDAVEWAREAAGRGAGEILLTSIDKDGTKSGFDTAMTAAVSDAVAIPVIASGGAGAFEHFAEVFTDGRADAALAASIFHFNEHSVEALKAFLAGCGIPVRA